MCKHPQPCNASHRQPVSGVSPPKPSAAHTEGFVDKNPQLLSMNLGGRWTSRHVHRWEMAAAPATPTLQCRIEQPRGQYCWVPSNSDFKQCLLAYLLLQIEDTCGTSITQWIAIHVHTVWELHMTWKSRDQQFPAKEEKHHPHTSPPPTPPPTRGSLALLLWFPHTALCVHICAAGERCYSGLQLALVSPLPNASTSAKAGMKEAFQRKQTNLVTSDKWLQ